MLKNHKNIFFILMFILVNRSAYADDPIVPSHLHRVMESTNLTMERIHEIEIYFDSNNKDAVLAKDQLEQVIPEINRYLDQETSSDCRETNVMIFLLDDSVLLDRDIMYFLRWSNWNNTDIWGAYNKSYSRPTQEIFISTAAASREGYVNYIAAHELYHNFQWQTCANYNDIPQIEEDASIFTRHFCQSTRSCPVQ